MRKYISMFSLLKQTFKFALDGKRMFRLLAIPGGVGFLLMIWEHFYPAMRLAEQVELQYEFNFTTIVLLIVYMLSAGLLLVAKVQQIVFFGDGKDDGYFFGRVNRNFFLLLANILNMLFLSLLCSCVLGSSGAYVLSRYVVLPVTVNMAALLGTVLLMPYFLIRFVLKIPAAGAGKELSLWQSWNGTRNIGPQLALSLTLLLFVPLGVVTLLYSIISPVLVGETVFYVFLNGMTAIAFLTACVLQGAFTAYLYARSDVATK